MARLMGPGAVGYGLARVASRGVARLIGFVVVVRGELGLGMVRHGPAWLMGCGWLRKGKVRNGVADEVCSV